MNETLFDKMAALGPDEGNADDNADDKVKNNVSAILRESQGVGRRCIGIDVAMGMSPADCLACMDTSWASPDLKKRFSVMVESGAKIFNIIRRKRCDETEVIVGFTRFNDEIFEARFIYRT
jgi:hypothetical protein